MIEEDKRLGIFEIFCDGCEEYASYDTAGNFMEFIKESKSDGWYSTKKNEVWIHYCTVCASLQH